MTANHIDWEGDEAEAAASGKHQLEGKRGQAWFACLTQVVSTGLQVCNNMPRYL